MTTTPQFEPVIRTQGLTRHFTRHKKTVEAVRGLDLEVGPGELVAFLGPNGAGKSTTLRMLTTLIEPTSGTALVAGHDVVRERREVRRSIGYVGQGNAAGHAQRGRDELVSQGRAFGLSRAAAYARAEELLEAFDLTEHAMRPVSTLSGGQRRRLDVAIGLVHTPRLLFLDEPSTGLDPQNRANLQEQIRRLHDQQGTTIVLTTHYLEEADAIADRVVVIDHGLVIADDTASRLKSGLGDLVTLGFANETAAVLAAHGASWALGDNASVERTGTTVRTRAPGAADRVAQFVTNLAAAGAPVRRVEVASATLDDVFLELTGRSLRETDSTDSRHHQQHRDRRRGSMTATITAPTTGPVTTRTREVSLPQAPGVLADTWNVMVRELRPVFREPASVLFAMVQPLVFLGLFAPLLPKVEHGSALQWFVPGIIAMTALMGASFTGANLTQEIVTGSHERLLVSPLSRSSLLVGRALKEIVPMLMQAAIIVIVVTPFSFDLHLAHVLVGVVVLAGFSIGVGALSFALALVSKDQDWLFWTVQQTLIFPVLLLAGVLLPLDGAPGWLRFASSLNPLTYVVEAERALFAGTFPVDTVLYGAVASAIVAAFGLFVGLRAMRSSS